TAITKLRSATANERRARHITGVRAPRSRRPYPTAPRARDPGAPMRLRAARPPALGHAAASVAPSAGRLPVRGLARAPRTRVERCEWTRATSDGRPAAHGGAHSRTDPPPRG